MQEAFAKMKWMLVKKGFLYEWLRCAIGSSGECDMFE